MLRVGSQSDLIALPWLWREKGYRTKGRIRQDDVKVSSQGME